MAGPGEVFSHIRQGAITRLVDSHSYSIYQLLQLLRPHHRGQLLRRALSQLPACDNVALLSLRRIVVKIVVKHRTICPQGKDVLPRRITSTQCKQKHNFWHGD